MNNALYGKTVENIRDRVDVRLVTSKKQLIKHVKKPHYKGGASFGKSLAAVHMGKTKTRFNKPIFIGFFILELSKLIMYEYHHGFTKPMHGDRAKLLFTDTDSLCYEIETENFYKDREPFVETHFDTSDIPPGHPSGIKTGLNKKVLNMMKCETNCEEISEFVGLRSKLYSFSVPSQDALSKVKCKGIKKVRRQKDDFPRRPEVCPLWQGNSDENHGHDKKPEAPSLHPDDDEGSPFRNDDKRHVLPDGVSTLALGHYKISEAAQRAEDEVGLGKMNC